MVLAPWIAAELALDGLQLGIMRCGLVGALLHVLCLFGGIVLLYFDRRRAAAEVAAVFLAANLVLTVITLLVGPRSYGLGYPLAALLGCAWAYHRLEQTLDDLEYLTFAAQPMAPEASAVESSPPRPPDGTALGGRGHAGGGPAGPARGRHRLSAAPRALGGLPRRRRAHAAAAARLLRAAALPRGVREHAAGRRAGGGDRQRDRGAAGAAHRALPLPGPHAGHGAGRAPARDPALRGRGGLPADPGAERRGEPAAAGARGLHDPVHGGPSRGGAGAEPPLLSRSSCSTPRPRSPGSTARSRRRPRTSAARGCASSVGCCCRWPCRATRRAPCSRSSA